ncbi:5-bromo-4-chloroindolyl phosphate hydrolysis family protein [Profundibacter sp.]|uniref:5-bromo-4-chloroindolyl phosphate hydrolysis family protein n=1 Tax=Profundibacter sp. TaxID=3101071 RepID=UPI003D1279D3
MAKRFRGEFSPNGSIERGKSVVQVSASRRAMWRANVLFFVPLPLAFRAFFKDPEGLALNLLAFGVLILAAWLTRDGVKAQVAYEERRVARRPAIPRKIFGSVLTGIGLFIAGYASGGVFSALIFGLLGVVLHGLTFGPDPMKDKGMEGIDGFQTERVARVVDKAEKHLAEMSDAILRAGDRKLEDRVAQFQATARDMFHTVEDDPRDLTAARKYLSVYLQGARDATVKFADLYARNHDEKAREDYEALLTDLEENFAAKTEKLMLDDRSDLDVEIEVLRERLQREGIRPTGPVGPKV